MTFKARYLHTNAPLEYWRTIHANDLTEAQYIAKRYTRKAYRLTLLIEEVDIYA